MSENGKKSVVIRSKSVVTPNRNPSTRKAKTKRNFSFSFKKHSDDDGGRMTAVKGDHKNGGNRFDGKGE